MRFLVILLVLFVSSVNAWDEYELELFDLVEDVNQNFYEFLGIKQDASSTDIRKAYRQMSLVWHPDKNSDPNAETKFRQLVAIYEVLKDENRRKRYHEVLEFGLPDWRMPVFYYRRVRKLGLLELAILLLSIITLGHYLVGWAVYWEKKLELDEFVSSHFKKKKKKGKINETEEMYKEAVEQLPRPRLTTLVPFQLVKLLIFTIINLPYFCTQLKQFAVDKWVEYRTVPEPEEPSPEPVVREKRKKRKKLFEFPTALTDDGCILDAVDEPPPVDGDEEDDDVEATEQNEDAVPVRWGCKWTPEEYSNLAKSMKKIPGGVPQRWEKIAAMLERTVSEVTAAAKRLKESGYTLMNTQQKDGSSDDESDNSSVGGKVVLQNGSANDAAASENESSSAVNPEESGKKKQVAAPVKICSNNWNQVQQKALELALTQFPKGTIDRWDRIAKCVPSKTKDDCIQRFKYISELVKQKTQKQS